MSDLFQKRTKEDYIQEWSKKADEAEYFQKMKDATQDIEEQKRLELDVNRKKLEAESSAFRYRLLDDTESMKAFYLEDMDMPEVPEAPAAGELPTADLPFPVNCVGKRHAPVLPDSPPLPYDSDLVPYPLAPLGTIKILRRDFGDTK